MTNDNKKEYSTIGIALGAVNQVYRLSTGDKFSYRSRSVKVTLEDLEEHATIEGLPPESLTESDIDELIDIFFQLPATLLLAAQYELDRQFVYSAYKALSSYAEENPEIDPRLPIASVLYGHVLEYLLRHEFSEQVVAEVLNDFDSVATTRFVIRQKAIGIKTGEYDIELPSAALLQNEDYSIPHKEIQAMMARDDMAAAEERVLQLCADAEKRFGMPHPTSLVILGQLRLATRQYRSASQLLRWAYEVLYGLLEEEIDYQWVPMLLSCGTNLTAALMELGRLDEALRQIQKSIGHYRDCTIGIQYELPESIRDFALSYQLSSEIDAVYITAKCYDLIGARKCAESLAVGAMIRSWALFDENPSAAHLQLLVGKFAAERGELAQAIGHLENASKQGVIASGDHILWFSLLARNGQIEQAREGLQELLSTDALEDDPNLCAGASTILAEIEETDGNFREGCRHRYNATQYSDQMLEILSMYLSTVELQSTAQRQLVYLYMFANAAADRFTKDVEIVDRLYESVTRRKFFVADVQRHIRQSTLDNPEYGPLWQDLKELQTIAGSAQLLDHNALEYDPKLDEVLRRIHDIEARLAEAAGGLKLPTLEIKDLVAALPPDTCLVEYLYVPELIPDAENQRVSTPRYIAFVLSTEGVQMQDLGAAVQIDDAVRTYLRRINAGVRNLDRHSEAIVSRIWSPIAALTNEFTDVIVVPDGELARLPFTTLKYDDSYLSDQAHMSFASTGRDLFRFAAGRYADGSAPVIFADPDFDVGLIEHPNYGWERLDGAREEGERIAGLLGVPPYLGADASEENLKALRSPVLLHLATHGYFQDARETSKAALENLEVNQVRRLALKGAGIVLAGANALMGNREDSVSPAHDGLLNELDILALDLTDTELVVLSACDTGLGSIRVGEGVMGMARAFVVSGADSIIMSLWKVPDEITSTMMTYFYEHLLAGDSRHVALIGAQKLIRKDYPEIDKWGAFVCYGSTGPISGKLKTNVLN
ncbi:MAG: CHAT domain-containing protein [Candidatus Thiodiazotropha taylori]